MLLADGFCAEWHINVKISKSLKPYSKYGWSWFSEPLLSLGQSIVDWTTFWQVKFILQLKKSSETSEKYLPCVQKIRYRNEQNRPTGHKIRDATLHGKKRPPCELPTWSAPISVQWSTSPTATEDPHGKLAWRTTSPERRPPCFWNNK